MVPADHPLDVHSWLVVITFMVVIVLVIKPIRIPLPIPTSQRPHSTHSLALSTAANTPKGAAVPVTNGTVGASDEITDAASATTIVLTTAATDNGLGSPSNATNPDNLNCRSRIRERAARKAKYPYHLTLNIATAPVFGILFLLATKSITGDTVGDGIIGESSGIEPYAVMILFFSLAYICISLDMTGVLQYAAFWISKRGGGGGQRIFLYFFLLSTIMSGLTSNDVVILTMTPFLVYFSHAVDLITPVAFLMAEVQTANIASMTLYIGNLTNVVACQAYKISFLEYSAWMLLPTFASIGACYVMLRINFRKEKYIPKSLKTPEVDPRSCLVDPFGAIFGLSVLTCSLICLIGTSFAHVSVWVVTGPFALLALCRDVWYDSQGKFKGAQIAGLTQLGQGAAQAGNVATGGVENRIEQGLPEIAVPDQGVVRPTPVLDSDEQDDGDDDEESVQYMDAADSAQEATRFASGSAEKAEAADEERVIMKSKKDDILIFVGDDGAMNGKQNAFASSLPRPSPLPSQSPSEPSPAALPVGDATLANGKKRHMPGRLTEPMSKFQKRFPLLHSIFIRMPWAILPFTFSMFIMVEGLSDSGWIAIFANWATKLVPNYIVATYAIGFVSVLLCNIFNNVPMTILVARVLQHPNFVNSPLATPEVTKGCLFALVVGSNLGACTTLISSLAGLMWDSVLRSKKSAVGFWPFFRWNMGVMPMVIFVALSVVVIELKIIFKV